MSSQSIHTSQPMTRQNKPVAIDLGSTQTKNQIKVRWDVSREAFKAHAPRGFCTTIVLELCVELDANQLIKGQRTVSSKASWLLIDPKSNLQKSIPAKIAKSADNFFEIQLNQAPANTTHQLQGTITLKASDTNIVLRNSEGSSEILYVRTKLFEHMNIKGGRYSPASCEIELSPQTP